MRVDEILGERRANRPELLTVGMVMSGFGGALFLLILVLAPFDIGTYTLEDETVTAPNFSGAVA